MMRKIAVLGIFLALMVALAGCGENAETAATGATEGSVGVRLNEDYTDAVPVSAQLLIGTLMLEETPGAVTTEQAGELLTTWQMFQALQGSGTAAEAEINTVLNQIQEAMTSEQLTAIQEMQLTPTSMMELAQEQGLMEDAGGVGTGGSVGPPAGVAPGGIAGEIGGVSPGENLSPEEQEAAMAERMNEITGSFLMDMLIELLEARLG